MKILAISAHHPPCHFGGYEIRVKNILDGLAARGHTIRLLTNHPGKESKMKDGEQPYPIIRKLHNRNRKNDLFEQMTTWKSTRLLGLFFVFLKEISLDIKDLKTIDYQIRQFQPDLIYFGQIIPLTRAIMPFISECKIPVVLDDGGGTLGILQKDNGIWLKFLDRYRNKQSHVTSGILKVLQFVISKISNGRIKHQWTWPDEMQTFFKREVDQIATLKEGAPTQNSIILHSGVDTNFFNFVEKPKLTTPVTIFYPSRIEPQKGQIDAIRLIHQLLRNKIEPNLILIGEIRETYLLELERESINLNVTNYLNILPMMPQNELIKNFHKADICFFPSHQELGFSRVPLEAMACGCIVISYGNEGSNEIISNGKNGYLVGREDYQTIIKIIEDLLMHPILVRKIQQQARMDIENNYSLDKYIDQIEGILVQSLEKTERTYKIQKPSSR